MIRQGGKNIRRSSVLSSGKTVEKALEKALVELNSSIDEVEIEIIDAGQKGMLSIFGSRDAQIRVSRKAAGSKGVEEAVDDIARTIMDCLDVNYRLFTKDEDDSTYINIETAGVDGLLIGRKGDTLNSLQHLIGRIVSKRMGSYQRLTLDVGGYLSNRRDIIKQKALKAAERAKKTGRDIPLEPMKAAERRIVHLALADVDGVTTYTIGNGEMRKVCVSTGRGDQGGSRHHNR